MANKNGGFIGTDGLDAPDPPTAVTPTAGNEQVSVAFTAPTDVGTSAIQGLLHKLVQTVLTIVQVLIQVHLLLLL